MFEVLLESGQQHHWLRLRLGSVASVAAHAAVVGVAMAGMSHGTSSIEHDSGASSLARYLFPPKFEASTPRQEGIRWVAMSAGVTQSEGIKDAGSDDGLIAQGGRGVGRAPDDVGDPTLNKVVSDGLHGEAPTFNIVDVDSTAVRDPLSMAPQYPPPLYEKGVEGYALVQFVVDTTGFVDLGSFRVMTASHESFATAVRSALPGMKFKPASITGHPVRQLVEQEFRFRIDPVRKTAS